MKGWLLCSGENNGSGRWLNWCPLGHGRKNSASWGGNCGRKVSVFMAEVHKEAVLVQAHEWFETDDAYRPAAEMSRKLSCADFIKLFPAGEGAWSIPGKDAHTNPKMKDGPPMWQVATTSLQNTYLSSSNNPQWKLGFVIHWSYLYISNN